MRRDSTVLDTLRATAVLLVLGAHVAEVLSAHGVVAAVEPWPWHIGRLGVLLFFVHTSTVLMMSLERTPLDGAALVTDFYVRRAFRIYPLAILTVMLVAAAGVPPVPWGQPVDVTAGVLASNVLLVQNLTGDVSVLAPLWSLPLEVQMYVVLPLVFFAIGSGRRAGVAAALWLGSAAAALWAPMSGAYIAPFAPCFMSGVIAYCVARRLSAHLPFWMFPVALAVALAAYLGISAADPWAHSKMAAWGVCLVIGVILPRFDETSSVQLRRTAAWIARYSYGIYLSHMVLLWLVFVILPDRPLLLQLAMFAALLVLVPMALYHTIEAPCVRLGAACAARLRQPAREMPSRA